MFATIGVLGIAALVHVVRYLLLIINRSTLLNPVVADAAIWLGVVASVAAIAVVIACAVALTGWLIARRAAAFAHRGEPDPRPAWELWVGCLLPPSVAQVSAVLFATATLDVRPGWTLMAIGMAVCLWPLTAGVWALVYVIELAQTEDDYTRLRNPIWVWWLLWLLSAVVSVFATATSSAFDAQGIGNNTVAMILAYLVALIAVAAAARLFDGFERKPVERPARRWVVVADAQAGAPGPTRAVEIERDEPAA
jgi:hypothetical protein